MRIGIVGSGIAGLSSAYRIAQSGHDVVLFEKQNSLGMDAHSLSINLASKNVRADVPSRMFNELQWPTLIQLYRELGAEFRPVNPTQSFSWLGGDTYLKLDVANRPWLAAQSLVNPRIRKTIQQARRLQSQGEKDLNHGIPKDLTFSQYLASRRFDDEFVSEFLYPTLTSTVLTCSNTALDNYPASLVLQVLKNLVDSPNLLRVANGTIDVIHRLRERLDDVRLGTPVTTVVEHSDSIEVAAGGETEQFDHLILATQANHINRLFANSGIAGTLERFEYEDVEIVVHTDPELMPVNSNDWSTFNMILSPESRTTMCSVWLNRFHDDWGIEEPVFQTINPICEPASDKVISRASLQRPTVTANSYPLWQAIDQYHEQPQRIWYVGSYAAPGVPLLESGVRSSWNVVQKLVPSGQVPSITSTP